MKKAFTIIELLLVISIIALLMGLVTTAAAGAIGEARKKKAASCCAVVQVGLETYYAQKGYWPGNIDDQLNRNGNTAGLTTDEIILDQNLFRSMMREILAEYKRGNACLDISGLFVSRYPGEVRTKQLGLDFMEAIRGTKKDAHGQKMKVSEMHFGYPEASHGYFRHFKVTYRRPSDSILIEQQLEL
mgnify:CR=1 FL=1